MGTLLVVAVAPAPPALAPPAEEGATAAEVATDIMLDIMPDIVPDIMSDIEGVAEGNTADPMAAVAELRTWEAAGSTDEPEGTMIVVAAADGAAAGDVKATVATRVVSEGGAWVVAGGGACEVD